MKVTSDHFINREISWLNFNQRVLEEARDPENPLLNRLMFLAITASNLDEFFMVRVGGLQQLIESGKRKTDAAGLTPKQQLQTVLTRTRQMITDQTECYLNELEPELTRNGIRRLTSKSLTLQQEQLLASRVTDEIYPIITPCAFHYSQTCPTLPGLGLHMLVRIAPENSKSGDRFAVLPLSHPFGRFITLPSDSGYDYILIEEVVRNHLSLWFRGLDILESTVFRITRNADIHLREEEISDLPTDMASILEERRQSDCVRVEIEALTSRTSLQFLSDLLKTEMNEFVRIDGPLNLRDFMQLSRIDGFNELKAEPWDPQPSPQIDRQLPMLDQIAKKSILLYHPYESFDPVVRLVEEAACDPSVLAIKQVLYRAGSDSPIIAALAEAAEAGKSVTALVELKARFDEERNIGWSQQLEQAGVQVIYGVRGLKTHAKACLIVRREPQGIVRYVHFGTGNYNEATAKVYGDVSLMTRNDDLGEDATAFFNAVCGWSQPSGLRKLLMAPIGIRPRLIELIDGEIERKKRGQKAIILLKMNSLVDEELIGKLYEASQAGVKIRLNVRGICCLRPGVPGISKNITVTSIVGRNLEHARIFYFYRGGEESVFFSSADWMPRNLDRRVELMIPVEEPVIRTRLIEIIKTHCDDDVKSWTLLPDGTYVRSSTRPSKKKRTDSQRFFFEQARQAAQGSIRPDRTLFRPRRPKKK